MSRDAGSLKAAEQSAKTKADHSTAGPILSCPQIAYEVIEICIKGEDGKPLANVAAELRKADDEIVRDKTDASGIARFGGLERRTYQLVLTELDKDAWEVNETQKLAAEEAKSKGEATWQRRSTPASADEIVHTVAQGDCISKLGDRFGFLPDTLWNHPANSELRQKRKDANILNPGDKVVIPARQEKTASVETGCRYLIRRKGIPEVLRIRFLRNGEPRADVPYLIRLTGGTVIPDRLGRTDKDGFVVEAVAPNVKFAKIVLGDGADKETHEFKIGHLNPIDTISGVKARLNALGYDCGDVDDDLTPRTTGAIIWFQVDHGLRPSGDPKDGAFLAGLQEAFLS